MILLYSDTSDPVTKAILSNQELKNKVNPISIKEFINDVEIYDTIIDHKVNLSWKIKNKLNLTNYDDSIVINRVIHLSSDLFKDFDSDDSDYAKIEFTSYLIFSLNELKNVIGRPKSYGLIGNQYPMSIQWEIAKKNNIQVPQYFWGRYANFKQEALKPCVVSKSLNQYYNWKINSSDFEYQDEESYLFYDRPEGVPILIYKWFDEFYHEYPSQNQGIDNVELQELYRKGEEIADIFEMSVFEMLLFFDPNTKKVSFGMINSLFGGVREGANFNQFICKSIEGEVKNEKNSNI